jgi:hypothetical protein
MFFIFCSFKGFGFLICAGLMSWGHHQRSICGYPDLASNHWVEVNIGNTSLCYTRAFVQGMSLLVFIIFLSLWPMHVIEVMDVLLYVEVNLLGIYPLYKNKAEGHQCDVSWTCKLACNSWFNLLIEYTCFLGDSW